MTKCIYTIFISEFAILSSHIKERKKNKYIDCKENVIKYKKKSGCIHEIIYSYLNCVLIYSEIHKIGLLFEKQ